MKRLMALVMLMLLLPALASAQGLDAGLEQALGQVDLAPLETAAREDNLRVYLLRLAKGEMIWDARQVLDTLLRRLLGEARSSFSRMMGLLAPALLASAAGLLGGKRKDVIRIAESACFLALAATIAADMQLYLREVSRFPMLKPEQAVSRMAEMMQALFPILLTLLAAVGGSHGAALLEPAVSAASGIVTALVRGVSLRLSTGVAVVTLLDHLSPRMRLSRLAGLLRTASNWLLGVAFTVFLGVTSLQGLTASAADGVSIRAAKYAVDNFVPVVGGMFADTMDTLVGCSLLIKNAVGVTGLALLLSAAAVPMIRTLCAVMTYRLCAALLQPVSPSRAADLLQGFSDALMLLFIIQLSVSAMFVLLVAQVLAVGNGTVGLR